MGAQVCRPYTVVLIVPTGIGAAVGGYAGDALPTARAIAAVADRLITHPNVLNGAQLYWPMANALYVEGYGLDQFATGHWGLRPVRQIRIGLVLDRAINDELKWRHLQAADAARATMGLDIINYVVTDKPLGVTLRTAASGATWGTLDHPTSLLQAAKQAIAAGAEAIAVVANCPDEEDPETLDSYRQGQGVDPLAGAEAVISHLIVREFQIPCAHAPALPPLPLDPAISPKSAAEELGHTFLPCVLAGLSRAPQFIGRSTGQRQLQERLQTGDIWADQVDAVVVPATAFGGSGVMALSQMPAQIIGVADNTTALTVTAEAMGIKAVTVGSYLEALGALVAHKAGISLEAMRPKMQTITPLKE